MPSPGFSAQKSSPSIPPELVSEAAILDYLGVSAKELKKIWWVREKMYHQFEISKGTGKVRTINAPDKRLKFLQRKISILLNQVYRVRNPVHGFVTGKSVKSNALTHLGKRSVLNIDLADFFPSITENRVIGVLESVGIQNRVASIIARLCCSNSHLPQGAPTSPVLSNMICFRLDRELLAFAKSAHSIYTRYADDITFSSYQPMSALFEGTVPAPGQFSINLLNPTLRKIIVSNGFSFNPDKAHFADRYSRKMVTGLKINQLLNVDRRYIRNIRAALYSVEKLGQQEAQKKFKQEYGGRSDLGAHLEGKISWLRFIRGQSDPVYRAVALRFNKSFPNQKIEVIPTEDEIRDRAVWVVEHFEGEMSQGTAFFLKDVGLVTAAHCVEDTKVVNVYHQSKPTNVFKANVLKSDVDRDLAVLEPKIPTNEYFQLERSTRKVVNGDDTTALGFPSFGPGDRLNIRSGKVSSLPVRKGLKLIEVTQKLTQGMSGGPLIDKTNAVVGIIHKGGEDEGRNFAISIEVLNSWLGI